VVAPVTAMAAPAVTVTATVTEPVVSDADKAIDDATKGIDENPGETIKDLIQLAKEGRWGPFIGLLLMFLIWITRKWVWKLIPKNVLPWLTLGLGMTATVAVELSLGVIWWKTLVDGLATSGIAMAFWSTLFKHFLGDKESSEEVTDG